MYIPKRLNRKFYTYELYLNKLKKSNNELINISLHGE